MAYITIDRLKAYIQDTLLTQGLDDNADGAVDDQMFAEVVAAAETEIHGYLEGRYQVPFASPPSIVLDADVKICAEILWLRRGNAGDQNPFTKPADALRKRLAAIGDGDKPLSTEIPATNRAGAVVSEPSKVDDAGGRTIL